MSIKNEGLENNNEIDFNNLFLKKHSKYTIYSTEFKKINLSKVFNYNQNISVNLNLNGDLLHRCFFEIEVPILNLTDSLINDNNYSTLKSNKLKNIKMKLIIGQRNIIIFIITLIYNL